MIRRLLYLCVFLCLSTLLVGWVVYERLGRTPGELLRYTEKRLVGHPKIEGIALPLLYEIRTRVETPVSLGELPSFGKGQAKQPLAQQLYARDGKPEVITFPGNAPVKNPATSTRTIASAAELTNAVTQAKAGDVLELLPGLYKLDQDLKTAAGGTPSLPIVLRTSRPGAAIIEFTSIEGIRIAHPYWVVENLTLRGRCSEDRYCEHAFHVFGAAKSTVIRNNLIEDYNAHIKVNGLDNLWPDDGLIQFNTIRNTRRRETDLPVTPIDIVGASRWTIADNIISNFIKGGGNGVSYGAFMKGGGSDGRIVRNMVVCTPQDISQDGVRVGLSMGGGGTGKDYCRNKRCDTEHTRGLIANNIIAHCNDFGIDVNTANQTVVAHNTLINTSGIDVRQAMASALVYGNILDGTVRSRNGALLELEQNLSSSTSSFFRQAVLLDLRWSRQPAPIQTHAKVVDDFCFKPRNGTSLPGAFADIGDCQ